MNGSIAGAFSGWLVTPLDVAKTRLMTYDINKITPGTLRIIKDIYSEEGAKGLFRGAQLRMIYLCVGGAAFFGIYERVKQIILSRLKE